jgi:hypothetical protein
VGVGGADVSVAVGWAGVLVDRVGVETASGCEGGMGVATVFVQAARNAMDIRSVAIVERMAW